MGDRELVVGGPEQLLYPAETERVSPVMLKSEGLVVA